jgi:hypothetical protein
VLIVALRVLAVLVVALLEFQAGALTLLLALLLFTLLILTLIVLTMLMIALLTFRALALTLSLRRTANHRTAFMPEGTDGVAICCEPAHRRPT